jgi:ABC transporter family protein
MKRSISNTIPARTGQQAQVRISLVVTILSLAVLGGFGAFQYHHYASAKKAAEADSAARALSPGTETVLNGLKSPVEIRFYSLLDPASTPESLRAFADRVNQLLAQYERDGNGKIRVVRFDEITDANSKAAAADGIHSFNREKGDASYLGIAAVRDGRRETMAELSPDWEQALESDLSRAVARVNDMTPPAATAANVSANELAAARKAIDSNPKLASVTLEQGTQMLRDQALADFKATVTEMQNQTEAAERRLAQGTGSESEIAGEIQKIRAFQTAKMQEITARLHDQLAALTQNKSAVH